MTNHEIARVLVNIADILEIQEENLFKIRAYRKAADSVYHLDEDIRNLYQKDRIGDIPGVGKAVKAKIEEMLEKSSCEYYEGLLSQVPAGVLEMLTIPGIGHKTVKIIYEQLGITSIAELVQAVNDKKIRTLPGMGEKSEYNIQKGIELLKENTGKFNLGLALPLAEEFLEYLMTSPDIECGSIVGSIRRGKPLVSDIDILVASHNFARVIEYTRAYKYIKKVTDVKEDSISGELGDSVKFEVIMVAPRDYYYKLIWTTGSKPFRSKFFTNIPEQELSGLASESELFSRQGLKYIPPELREDRGELETAKEGNLPQLISQSDIKGDLHVHSEWSDGAEKIQDMAAAAQKLGYQYIAITDHSKSLTISGGLNEERLSAQSRVINALNENAKDFCILRGIEVDILKDGTLDFTDDILERLDVVIASIHSNFKLDKELQTERVLKVIKNKNVNIIGHLTGRLLNRRKGYELDLDKVLEAAAKNNVVLEINAHPDRLDIDEHVARKTRDYGIKIAINSDAHHKEDLNLMIYGILNARRGWLTPDDVINTWDKYKLLEFLQKKKD